MIGFAKLLRRISRNRLATTEKGNNYSTSKLSYKLNACWLISCEIPHPVVLLIFLFSIPTFLTSFHILGGLYCIAFARYF
jgi:hypothetical protein